MELKGNEIVRLRNGKFGAVVTYGGTAKYIVFNSFISKLNVYNNELKHNKNSDYDIVCVYEPIEIEKLDKIFSPSMNDSWLKVIEKIND